MIKRSLLPHSREELVLAGFFIVSLALIGRIAFLSLRAQPQLTYPNIPAIERGSIYDRNGKLLSEQVETFTLSLWLPMVREKSVYETDAERQSRIRLTADALAPIVLWPKDDLYALLLNEETPNTLYLARKAPIEIRDAALEAMEANGLRGLRADAEFSRIYPNGALAANLIGYVNLDNQGGEGLEYAFDRVLSPPALGSDSAISDGDSLELTIDADLQAIVEELLKESVAQHKADAAVALVADAKTAEILSYASLPSYNPNFYNRSSAQERMNRPVVETYEPGSVFKIFSIASLLDMGLISRDDQFFCSGFYEKTVGRETIRIKCQGAHGWQTPEQILANSCNAGTAYASDLADNREFYQMLLNFGFGKKTDVPLSGETAGIFYDPDRWSARSKPTIAMGQEIGVSAMQIVQAATVFTNGGLMLKPQIVKRVFGADGKVKKSYGREGVREVLKPASANQILQMLKSGVTQGIAARMYVPGLQIAAKTGTSQTYDPAIGGYSDTSFIASALALFPAEEPRYIVYIAVHRPMGSTYWGATIVAPLIKNIIEQMIPFAGLEAAGVQEYKLNSQVSLARAVYPQPQEELPDFTGMALRQALSFFNANQVFYKIEGNGKTIIDQFPPPNTLLRPGMTIKLETQ